MTGSIGESPKKIIEGGEPMEESVGDQKQKVFVALCRQNNHSSCLPRKEAGVVILRGFFEAIT
jgi:hypothetical protein